jgi:hypothetical protein
VGARRRGLDSDSKPMVSIPLLLLRKTNEKDKGIYYFLEIED